MLMARVGSLRRTVKMTSCFTSRPCSRLLLVTLVATSVACGDESSKADTGRPRDAGDRPRDASQRDASHRLDAANAISDAGDDEVYWRCNLNDYGCYCREQRSRPLSNQACDTSGCCLSVRRDDEQTCACMSSAGLALRQQTCEAWFDEQMASCEDAECVPVAACPPGTPPVSTADAGRDAGAEDASDASDAAAEEGGESDGGVPPIPNQGPYQHCVHREGCFEFRNHRPSCYESNQINCEIAFFGSYAMGKCPAGSYKQTIVDQTGCGETGSYVK